MIGRRKMHNQKYLKFLFFLSVLLILLLVGCISSLSTPTLAGQSTSIEYRNTEYGFSFTLPASWKGYAIITDQWQGLAVVPTGEAVVEQGPLISIRYPNSEVPRQDIPIMVFTNAQWDSVQQGNFHIGAAPIGPSELGRNAKFVFALPARYNYAFPTGYEEVEAILQDHPLHTP